MTLPHMLLSIYTKGLKIRIQTDIFISLYLDNKLFIIARKLEAI